MRTFRLLLFCGTIASLASCQASHSAFVRPSAGALAASPTNQGNDAVLLLHDSQGPQATRVVLSAAEAATFRQQ